ncbi:MAG: amidohydrolase family protein [Planctomycetes bacterium]|nr:amidohydrolase family protein [Planctomycetota bacterium]
MTSSSILSVPIGALLLAGAAVPLSAGAPQSTATIAVQAGTIHLVENGTVLQGGATILVSGGKIRAVGKDIAIPAGAQVVDYGPDAIIVPGLVAADSNYGGPRPSDRTADPFIRAVDNFDPYDSFAFALQEGVTTAYLAPGRGRLIAGQGAVVKLAGDPDAQRVVNPSAVVHGSIGADARNTRGYWEPPVPATIDVGMGVAKDQLPKTLMGAIVALQELFDLSQGGPDAGEYGPGVGKQLRELIAAKTPWRITADTEAEIRAAIEFFKKTGQTLVLDGANEAALVADFIARSGVSVIVEAPFVPNRTGRDMGKDRDSTWARYDSASALAKAGARFAIAPTASAPASDLRFAAGLMSRGGLDRDAALRAITLTPAEILGVADRVGSIAVGKDADFAVFNAHPIDSSAGIIATWVDGQAAFKAYEATASAVNASGGVAGFASAAVVVHVDNLYIGDGEVLSPGEMLMQNGRISAVGQRVGRPAGAVVVKAAAAAPGMIDALGHLGLEGSSRVPATRFEMKRLVEPGDFADRRVARAGVTTVALSPRGVSRSGAPMMAYKPAGDDLDRMVVADPCALRLNWTDRNRRDSGRAVKDTLKKAADYAKKWAEYEEKLAKWTPPEEGAAPKAEAEKEGDAKKDEEKKEGDADKKDEKKDDKKKKKGEEEPPKPITGAWETKITLPPFDEARMRLYVNDEDGKITGSLRCDALSTSLIQVEGKRDKFKVTLSGDGSRGTVKLEGEAKEGKLTGHVQLGDSKSAFEATQTSTEYEIAGRSEVRKDKADKDKKPEVKGEPKAPGIDPDLEPLRRAMMGKAGVVVGVSREDELVDCVDAFAAVGIKPILYGAEDAWKVADKLRGRVAGVLLTPQVTVTEAKTGVQKRNRYAELGGYGIPVAFHSDAEEGAADLPLIAAYAVSQGMSPEAALIALTSDAARMLAIHDRVGLLRPGMDADVVLYDRSPLDVSATVLKVFVNGKEVR